MKKLFFDAPTGFTVTTASQEVLAADRARQFTEIVNVSPSVTVFLAFGEHDAEVNKGTPLMPNGGTVTLTAEYMRCMQRVSAICGSTTAPIAIQVGR